MSDPFTTIDGPAKIGAGGQFDHISISNDGATRVVRTDSANTFIYEPSLDKYRQIVVYPAFTAFGGSNYFDGLPTVPVDKNGTHECVVSPSDANRVYLMLNGDLFVSTNRCVSFNQCENSNGSAAFPTQYTTGAGGTARLGAVVQTNSPHIAVDPANPDVCLVGTTATGAAALTTNGVNFSFISTANIPLPVYFHPDPVGRSGYDYLQCLVAFDGTQVSGGRTQRAYACSQGNQMRVSIDACASWQATSGGPTAYSQLEVDANGNAWVCDVIAAILWKFIPGSSGYDGTWSQVKTSVTGFVISPSDPNTIVISNGGAIDISSNGGSSWTGAYNILHNTGTISSQSVSGSVIHFSSVPVGVAVGDGAFGYRSTRATPVLYGGQVVSAIDSPSPGDVTLNKPIPEPNAVGDSIIFWKQPNSPANIVSSDLIWNGATVGKFGDDSFLLYSGNYMKFDPVDTTKVWLLGGYWFGYFTLPAAPNTTAFNITVDYAGTENLSTHAICAPSAYPGMVALGAADRNIHFASDPDSYTSVVPPVLNKWTLQSCSSLDSPATDPEYVFGSVNDGRVFGIRDQSGYVSSFDASQWTLFGSNPVVLTLKASGPTATNSNVLHFGSTIPSQFGPWSFMSGPSGRIVSGQVVLAINSPNPGDVTLTGNVDATVNIGDSFTFYHRLQCSLAAMSKDKIAFLTNIGLYTADRGSTWSAMGTGSLSMWGACTAVTISAGVMTTVGGTVTGAFQVGQTLAAGAGVSSGGTPTITADNGNGTYNVNNTNNVVSPVAVVFTRPGWGSTGIYNGSGDTYAFADRVNADTVYWMQQADNYGGLFRSTDGGINSTRIYAIGAGTPIAKSGSQSIKAVPGNGNGGHIFISAVNVATGGAGQATFQFTPDGLTATNDGAGAVTWHNVVNESNQAVRAVTAFNCNGKPRRYAGYPTLFFWGLVNGVWGMWRGDNFNPTSSTVGGMPAWGMTCTKLSMFPYDIPTLPVCVEGDINAFGKCYVGTGGSGFVKSFAQGPCSPFRMTMTT